MAVLPFYLLPVSFEIVSLPFARFSRTPLWLYHALAWTDTSIWTNWNRWSRFQSQTWQFDLDAYIFYIIRTDNHLLFRLSMFELAISLSMSVMHVLFAAFYVVFSIRITNTIASTRTHHRMCIGLNDKSFEFGDQKLFRCYNALCNECLSLSLSLALSLHMFLCGWQRTCILNNLLGFVSSKGRYWSGCTHTHAHTHISRFEQTRMINMESGKRFHWTKAGGTFDIAI